MILINTNFNENTTYRCELCEREVTKITKHHLIPKEKGGKNLKTSNLCETCHKQIHALFTNRELSARLFTIKRLKSNELIKKYLNFIYNIPSGTEVSIKKRKRKIG